MFDHNENGDFQYTVAQMCIRSDAKDARIHRKYTVKRFFILTHASHNHMESYKSRRQRRKTVNVLCSFIHLFFSPPWLNDVSDIRNYVYRLTSPHNHSIASSSGWRCHRFMDIRYNTIIYVFIADHNINATTINNRRCYGKK